MYQLLRFVHVMGLALFLGSLISFDIMHAAAPAINNPEFIGYAKIIEAMATSMTLFGLVMAVGSGAFLIGLGKFSFGKSAWLGWKIFLTIILVMNTMFMIMPNIEAALHFAKQIPKGVTPYLLGKIKSANDAIHLYSVISMCICVLMAYLGIMKTNSFKFLNPKNFKLPLFKGKVAKIKTAKI